ncbi:hypothetical protein [Dactylosporangium sp. CA-233914]|uniref:hypothetical protein n=1 Tax=Dactylosporangium sp. CA-233914 TaxID=3239934 RepID=UPI003D8D970C
MLRNLFDLLGLGPSVTAAVVAYACCAGVTLAVALFHPDPDRRREAAELFENLLGRPR